MDLVLVELTINPTCPCKIEQGSQLELSEVICINKTLNSDNTKEQAIILQIAAKPRDG